MNEVRDVMVRSGGGHKPIHAKHIPPEHPLFKKLFPYRWNPKRYVGKGAIRVTTSIYNWISAGKEIREGEHIYHLNGDSLDDNIDNLIALTEEEKCKVISVFKNWRNGKNCRYPKELVEAYIVLIRLNKLRGEDD